jgi:two-component system, cell cycle sensor histidine kinase and response regulator CckA
MAGSDRQSDNRNRGAGGAWLTGTGMRGLARSLAQRLEFAFVPDQLLPDGSLDARAVQRRYRRMVALMAIGSTAIFAPSMLVAGVPQGSWVPFTAAVAATASVIAASLLVVPARSLASLVASGVTGVAVFALDHLIGGYYHQTPLLYAVLVAGFTIIQGFGAAVVMVVAGALLLPFTSPPSGGAAPSESAFAFLYLFGVTAIVWTYTRLQGRAEVVIRGSQAEYRHLIERIPAIAYRAEVGPSGRFLYASPRVAGLLGVSAEELVRSQTLWWSLIHPDDLDRVLADDMHDASPSKSLTAIEYRVVARDGSVRWVHDEATFVPAEAGAPAHWSGFLLDVTAHKELEDQLRHAQRMEAVGQLAGGIAHDFNNLLTAIQGYGALLQERLPAGSAEREDLDEMLRAAGRAGTLVGQLLAFSRRQVLQPRVFDAAEVVDGLTPMLMRLLGTHVALATHRDDEPAGVAVDRGQLEQVIVNLAVNARDAMPAGGSLTIETSCSPAAGETSAGLVLGWVRITVADTGLGMDAATRARIFEPFFTTKDVGKGTGMGLATVHGIVEQSGGRIACTSAPGAGTTFTIELPRVGIIDLDGDGRSDAPIRGGTERILLVEDEPAVLAVTGRVLAGLGYEVCSVGSAAEALGLLAADELPVDLLLTDVQMPGMQGPELIRRARTLRPGVAAMLMSGFPGDDYANSSVDPSIVPLLHKPFDLPTLARTTREALDLRR